MARFFHHPDGLVAIESEDVGVVLQLDYFKLFAPTYSLPEGAVGREYIVGVAHRIWDNNATQVGQAFPWPEGDGHIARVREIALAYQRSQHRQSIPKNPLERKVKPLW